MSIHTRLIRYKALELQALDHQAVGENAGPVEEYEDNAFTLISEMKAEELCSLIEEMLEAERVREEVAAGLTDCGHSRYDSCHSCG